MSMPETFIGNLLSILRETPKPARQTDKRHAGLGDWYVRPPRWRGSLEGAMSKKTAPKGGRFTRALAYSLGAAQPLGRELIDGVELCAPDHAAWVRGKCNRRSHVNARLAKWRACRQRNCGMGQDVYGNVTSGLNLQKNHRFEFAHLPANVDLTRN